jgi:deazaflavin-dependent oxidoreductase (nitroreductase family)
MSATGSMSDFNRQVVEEFRANGGKVGGNFGKSTLLLLTTTGAKTGQPRIAPLGYIKDGDRYVVLASNLGAPNHPDWYHNLVAHPDVTVEAGTERFAARATTAEGAERERLVAYLATAMPFLADHQARTTRQIPIVLLERTN